MRQQQCDRQRLNASSIACGGRFSSYSCGCVWWRGAQKKRLSLYSVGLFPRYCVFAAAFVVVAAASVVVAYVKASPFPCVFLVFLLLSRRLREGENEVIYTETDCISGLPMFRGDLVVKTTYRVTRDEDDPDNSVHVKVTGCWGLRLVAPALSL